MEAAASGLGHIDPLGRAPRATKVIAGALASVRTSERFINEGAVLWVAQAIRPAVWQIRQRAKSSRASAEWLAVRDLRPKAARKRQRARCRKLSVTPSRRRRKLQTKQRLP